MNRKTSRFYSSDNRPVVFIVIISLILGIALMGINLYGLTQQIRKPGLGTTDYDELRFIPKRVPSYSESIAAIDSLAAVKDQGVLVDKANMIVHRSLVHVDWERVNPVEYRQLIPIWDNYFLWAIGRFSGLPQFARYHYAGYHRNILRGIGICGDASTVLSSVMDRYGVANRIVSFDGHVIVEYKTDRRSWTLIDPDFGVALHTSLNHLVENLDTVKARYLARGYSYREIDYLFSIYEGNYEIFDDTYDFMKLRYLFEEASYIAKWVLPLLLMILSGIWIFKTYRRETLDRY